jgi:hypothetical protein
MDRCLRGGERWQSVLSVGWAGWSGLQDYHVLREVCACMHVSERANMQCTHPLACQGKLCLCGLRCSSCACCDSRECVLHGQLEPKISKPGDPILPQVELVICAQLGQQDNSNEEIKAWHEHQPRLLRSALHRPKGSSLKDILPKADTQTLLELPCT